MAVTGNSSLLKDINRSLIINTIKQHEPLSRADLVNMTNLALPTVLRNVNDLLKEGILIETGKVETGIGRRPIMLEINKSAGYYIGVSFGRKIKVILTDFAGNILRECFEDAYMAEGPEGNIQQIRRIIFSLIRKNKIKLESIIGMGVATLDTGFKIGADKEFDFVGWENVDNASLIQKIIPEIKCKCEYLPVCGAVAEQWFGNSIVAENILYIFVDYGVGGGLVLNGKVYMGKDGHPAHIGHHVVDYNGRLCYCGNQGCLETYISTLSILKEVRRKTLKDEMSDYFKQFKEDVSQIDFNKVIDRYKSQDPTVVSILENAGTIFGVGLANAINLFNPDVIVLGGEMSFSFPGFVETAIKVAKDQTFMLSAKAVSIQPSRHGLYTEALGAIALIMSEVYNIKTLR